MNQKRKRRLVLLTGWGFILLGLAGLFLPILQGLLFLLIGLVILSSEYVWAHSLLAKLHNGFPKMAAHSHQAFEKYYVKLASNRPTSGWPVMLPRVGNGKQRKARSADTEPHDYCGRPVL